MRGSYLPFYFSFCPYAPFLQLHRHRQKWRASEECAPLTIYSHYGNYAATSPISLNRKRVGQNRLRHVIRATLPCRFAHRRRIVVL